MKILLHAGVDLSLPGGLETHVRELALGLMARGHDVEIHGRPAQLPPFRMVDAIRPGRYDIVHHHGSVWPAGVDPGARYVRSFHFCTAAKMEVYVRMGRLRTLLNPGNWRGLADERRSCHRPGRMIAVSPRLARELEHYYGMDPAGMTMIPNGATFSAPAESRAAIRARHGIADDAPLLLTIGRADYVKGYDLLERAWARVRAALPGAVWVGVGGAAAARAPGRLITGSVPHAEVVSWVHAADVGAMPSYYEGCGLAILEMLCGGLYVLSHDVGIAPQAIRGGANGQLVERDAEAWSAAMIAELRRLPKGAGLDPCFRWERIVERVEAVYEQVRAGH